MGLIILTLLGLKYLPGWVKLVWLFHVAKAEIKFAIEIQGEKKKALEGVAIFLYYFN